MAAGESFWGWLSDWLARPSLARLKPRFGSNRASFLTAAIASTQNKPEQGRLFSHYRLTTGRLLQGASGLAALRDYYGKAGSILACLRCVTCGHEYVIAVQLAGDPLRLPSGQGAMGYPASFTSDWFRFWHPGCRGEASLSCPHCELRGRPESRYL